MESEIVSTIVSIAVTGVLSSLSTVVMLKADVRHIKETLARHEKTIQRAHDRLDEHIREYHKP